jgi:hypothetical protein
LHGHRVGLCFRRLAQAELCRRLPAIVHGYRRFRGLAPTFSRGSAGPSTNFSAWPVRKEAALTVGVADVYAAIAGGSKGYWQLAKMLPNVLRG